MQSLLYNKYKNWFTFEKMITSLFSITYKSVIKIKNLEIYVITTKIKI